MQLDPSPAKQFLHSITPGFKHSTRLSTKGVKMNYRYTIVYVENVPETLLFYEAAFGFKTLFLHEGGDYGELATGDTKLAFSSHKLMAELGKNVGRSLAEKPCYELAFETADVPAALAQAIGAGAILIKPTTQLPWGQTIAYVAAPEGTLIELCTPVAP